MGILGNLLTGGLFDFASKIVDKIFPDPQAKAAAQIELMKLQVSGELARLAADTDIAKAQMAINQAEATNTNVFVSGWRPFIGWICGVGLGTQFILNPFVTYISLLAGNTIVFPSLDLGLLTMLVSGMLGLGSLRTYEKVKGVAST